MVKPSCSNFRVITANVSDVQIFRIFTVLSLELSQPRTSLQNQAKKSQFYGSLYNVVLKSGLLF